MERRGKKREDRAKKKNVIVMYRRNGDTFDVVCQRNDGSCCLSYSFFSLHSFPLAIFPGEVKPAEKNWRHVIPRKVGSWRRTNNVLLSSHQFSIWFIFGPWIKEEL
jgi:hypothetical protein